MSTFGCGAEVIIPVIARMVVWSPAGAARYWNLLPILSLACECVWMAVSPDEVVAPCKIPHRCMNVCRCRLVKYYINTAHLALFFPAHPNTSEYKHKFIRLNMKYIIFVLFSIKCQEKVSTSHCFIYLYKTWARKVSLLILHCWVHNWFLLLSRNLEENIFQVKIWLIFILIP